MPRSSVKLGFNSLQIMKLSGPLSGVSNLRTVSSDSAVVLIASEPVSIWSWAAAALGDKPQGGLQHSLHDQVTFIDGRLPHCLLDVGRQNKMGFLIVARTVPG
ncbi:unnamed protein product, partial [Symbiodinium sp. CCMP2592]